MLALAAVVVVVAAAAVVPRLRSTGPAAVRSEAVPPLDADPPPTSATAELFDSDGDLLATSDASLDAGLWRFALPLDPGAQPAAVQVTGAGGDALSFASTVVLPASTADHPARALFPAVDPVSSYEHAWRYTLTHPDDPRSDWRWALKSTFGMVSNGRPSTPTFDDVVTRSGGFAMHGCFTANGGAGTFELARLRADGPWFVMSLQDDAIDVRDVEVTPSEVRVTMVVAEDYRLAVARSCPGSAGEPVEEAWGHAGVELLCRFLLEPPAASDRIARSIQTLETLDDRSLLRYDDAWSP